MIVLSSRYASDWDESSIGLRLSMSGAALANPPVAP
jgi:hypothetical protein